MPLQIKCVMCGGHAFKFDKKLKRNFCIKCGEYLSPVDFENQRVR